MDNKDVAIIVLGALLAFAVFGGAGYRMMGYGYSPYGMMYGYGFSWMWIFMLACFILIVLAIVWIVRQFSASNSGAKAKR